MRTGSLGSPKAEFQIQKVGPLGEPPPRKPSSIWRTSEFGLRASFETRNLNFGFFDGSFAKEVDKQAEPF